jgi:hypothetical protein
MAMDNNGQALTAQLVIGGQVTNRKTPDVFRISDSALNREIISLSAKRFGYQTEQRELTLVRGKADVFTFELRPTWWWQIARFGSAGLIMWLWIWPWWAWYRWYGRWRRSGRDPKSAQLINPSLGPGQLTPSVLGVVIDERVDRRDLTAGILFLGVHRFLTIERLDKTWGHGRRNFSLSKLTKNSQLLGTFEKSLYHWIFELGSKTTLADLAIRHHQQPKYLTAELYTEVVAQGYFSESPAEIRHRYMHWPIRWLTGSVILGLVTTVWYPRGLIAALPLIIVSVMALLFASIMPKKTLKGAEVSHWSGKYAEKLFDDQHRSSHSIPRWEFERTLPYMLVLDTDAMWLSDHRESLTAWPEWLRSTKAREPYTATKFTRLYNQFILAGDAVFNTK